MTMTTGRNICGLRRPPVREGPRPRVRNILLTFIIF
jgi:hypothetical protein